MRNHTAHLVHITTNPAYCTDEVKVYYYGVAVRVGMNTGNWHPPGKPWLASIRGDRSNFTNPENWAMGLGAWGATRDEAISNEVLYAQEQTLHFPPDWINKVKHALECEYGNA